MARIDIPAYAAATWVVALAYAMALFAGGCGGGGGSIKGRIDAVDGGGTQQKVEAAPASKVVYRLERPSTEYVDLRSVNVDGSGDVGLATGGYVYHFDAIDSSSKVAYIWAPDIGQINQYDAYTVGSDGKPGIKLPNIGSSTEWSVRWSADGTNIYYMRSYLVGEDPRRDIFRANADGANEVNVTNNSTWAGWKSMYFDFAKNETSFVYSAGAASFTDKQIVKFDTAAATETILFAAGTGTSRGPLISPDGNKLAYFTNCSAYSCKNLIFTDSASVILRTTVNKSYYAREGAGVWAPDSDRFAIMETGSVVVYTMSSNDKKTILAGNSTSLYYVTDWSDDGSKLAGIKFVPYGDSSILANVIIFNPDGTGLFQVTKYTTDENQVDRALFAR